MKERHHLDLLVTLLNLDAEIADCHQELMEVMQWLMKLPEDRRPYGADWASALAIKLDKFRAARRSTAATLFNAYTGSLSHAPAHIDGMQQGDEPHARKTHQHA
ncbi:hypothetical protein KZJ38_07180 [Paraburkholderia edwinii]|uniref:Uncharacterized protein n=1 Tax=Paraburkholderia edwinii TaxID=2861782 RepID=A0ABX8UP63_9BURK|nr:hypothetical protein [Paraburkholderia edwinii]QYD70087.1 hypothetical protein KZJ38_07180 [Paraburkholderia edwinii]